MTRKRDPEKQAALDAARERILAEREQRVSDVAPVAHDAPSYDIFEAAPSLTKAEAAATSRAIARVVTEERDERLAFIDRVAIGLYVSGYPQTKIYDHAARLWELRAQWRKGQGL